MLLDTSLSVYRPAGRLVPVLAAHAGADTPGLALRMGRFAASLGETALVLDARGGEVLRRGGIVAARTLAQATRGECALRDCTFVTANEHFCAAELGDLSVGEAAGTLAALSLDFDWVFAVPPVGLSRGTAKLAAGADATVLAFDAEAEGDQGAGDGDAPWLHPFWVVEAVRARHARFDPHVVAYGGKGRALEAALALDGAVRARLGGPGLFAGHEGDPDRVEHLLDAMRAQTARAAA